MTAGGTRRAFALALAATALIAGLLTVSNAAAAWAAASDATDAKSTLSYLTAQYKLVTTLLQESAVARDAESAAAAQIAQGCRGVLSGMPQSSVSRLSEPTPRVRGENARLSNQQQTIEAELATAITQPTDSVYRPAEEAYAAEVSELSWSNPTIAALIQAETTATLEKASTPALSFCADASAWAQSGFRALSAASREFEASQAARRSAAPRGARSLGTLLKPYEDTSDRALVRKTNALSKKLLAGLGGAFRTDFRLDRIVGFPQTADEEPRKQITLGRGRTAAGTRFAVSTTSGFLSSLGAGSCHRSVSVFYSRLGDSPEGLIQGGPNNPICVSRPQERHPALFCEVGVETIQTAVPASVRSVRLMLADGHTIESQVVSVPRKDGGPAGIYAQEIRGSSSHAVTLVELNADGVVELSLDLPRYRCVKPREQREIPARVVELATGNTPEGEFFRISAFGSINGEPFVTVDTGVDPEVNEIALGAKASRGFPWSLSIGCAPHPYAILYGILAPPGASVTAQTAQGAVALNVVPIESRLHAKGQLVYGVFSALPSELTVLGTNGSSVYTENLQSQATEAAEFCEGYEEPAS
jgi:hypothetical protein